MTSATTIRIDSETKKQAVTLAGGLGIPFNALVNALLKKAIREGGVDLRLNRITENGYSEEFERSVLATDNNDVDYREFGSIDEMVAQAQNES